jgi:hypothetical protein
MSIALPLSVSKWKAIGVLHEVYLWAHNVEPYSILIADSEKTMLLFFPVTFVPEPPLTE